MRLDCDLIQKDARLSKKILVCVDSGGTPSLLLLPVDMCRVRIDDGNLAA